jgi:UDP-glucose 4-epimerase
MKSLITGGAGFIGSHLCEELLRRGDTIVVLDDLSTGRLENLHAALATGQVRFVEGDIIDEALLRELTAECDRIFHLAAAVGVKLILERPLHTMNVNMTGTHNVLEAACDLGKPVLLASTSEVYGHQVAQSFREETPSLLGPVSEMRWIYAVTKLADEYLAAAYAQERGLSYIAARFFNTTGPRQTGRYGMVVPRFVQAALAGDPITIYGDGRQVRCFCHVADVIRAVADLMSKPETYGDVYNIGSDQPITIQGLAERVLELTGSSSPIEYVAYTEAYDGLGVHDIRYRAPDISKLSRTIGFRPKHTLDEILTQMIEYYSTPGRG